MSSVWRFLASRWGPTVTGLVVGVLAPVLVFWGNPGNMGICVVCFTRDIAGALGLQRAATVQYIRPEIIGLMLGALGAALAFREFKPRTGFMPLHYAKDWEPVLAVLEANGVVFTKDSEEYKKLQKPTRE